jgi:hypothetical protein
MQALRPLSLGHFTARPRLPAIPPPRQRIEADLHQRQHHGLRHHYAQTRYADPTGWKAPAAGGPTSKQLSAEQKVIDRQARLTISRELGHEREQITEVYLGR